MHWRRNERRRSGDGDWDDDGGEPELIREDRRRTTGVADFMDEEACRLALDGRSQFVADGGGGGKEVL